MLLDNYLKLKQETLLLILLIIFSFLVRIPIIIIFGDAAIENEWEPLLYNLVEHKTLSFTSQETKPEELNVIPVGITKEPELPKNSAFVPQR